MGRRKKYLTEEDRMEANRKRAREYYQQNKVDRTTYDKQYYQEHREEKIQQAKEYRKRRQAEIAEFEANAQLRQWQYYQYLEQCRQWYENRTNFEQQTVSQNIQANTF